MAGHKEFNSKARATQAGNPQKGNPLHHFISHVQESRVPSPTNTNTPVLHLPPALYAEPDVTQYGMSLGSAGLSCPVPVTSGWAPSASCLLGQYRTQGRAGLCRHCSATAKTSPCYLFQYKSTAPFYSCEAKELPQLEPVHLQQRISEFLPHFHKTAAQGLNHTFLGHICSQLEGQGFKVTHT